MRGVPGALVSDKYPNMTTFSLPDNEENKKGKTKEIVNW